MDSQFYTKTKSHTLCTVPDIWAAKKKEWVAVYNDQVIIGRVIYKCKASSIVYVEHWHHVVKNIHVSPKSSEILAIRCKGCSLHCSHLNSVKYSSQSKNFPCIAPYFCALSVVILKIKRITDDEYILRSSFFAIGQ